MQDLQRETFNHYYASLTGGKLFRWLDHAKIRQINAELRRRPAGTKVLDLGCGSGAIAARLTRLHPDKTIIGADHSQPLLDMAAARGVQIRLVDFDKQLPFEDDSLDVILMIDTIEHVESRQATLREVKRMLSPSGTIIVFTPPYDSLMWWLGERFFNIVTRRRADHISPFTTESLHWLLSTHFEACKIGMLNFRLSMYGIAERKR